MAGRSSESSPELRESLPIADRPAHTAEVTSSGCSLKPKHVVAQIGCASFAIDLFPIANLRLKYRLPMYSRINDAQHTTAREIIADSGAKLQTNRPSAAPFVDIHNIIP